MKSEEAVTVLRGQPTLLQQEGMSLLTELAPAPRSLPTPEARNRKLEAAAEELKTSLQVREEAKRARDAEQHLRAEVEKQAASQQRLHELEELAIVQKAKLAFLHDKRCRTENQIRQSADLGVSLEAASDPVAGLKALVLSQKAQLQRLAKQNQVCLERETQPHIFLPHTWNRNPYSRLYSTPTPTAPLLLHVNESCDVRTRHEGSIVTTQSSLRLTVILPNLFL